MLMIILKCCMNVINLLEDPKLRASNPSYWLRLASGRVQDNASANRLPYILYNNSHFVAFMSNPNGLKRHAKDALSTK
eukprot:6190299-Pleurochrysis_carterae.AAC.3